MSPNKVAPQIPPATQKVEEATLVTQNALSVWNRPYYKERGVNQPSYTDEQVKARENLVKLIHDFLSGQAEALGCYITPNNNGDGSLVACSLTVPPFEFTAPDGSRMATRPFPLNINAAISKDPIKQGDIEPDESQEALSFDDMMKGINQKRAEKKASKNR